jgi:NADH:ubiquinone oxidoreductase subunit 5 (subunit L)/multisubunit Na+/H+ antiporter MnhA subunit
MADSLASAFKPIYTTLYNKYWVDEIYDATVVKPLVGGSRWVLWKGADAGLIDGSVNGVGTLAQKGRRRLAPAAIRQCPQLRHLGALRFGVGDRGHGHRQH